MVKVIELEDLKGANPSGQDYGLTRKIVERRDGLEAWVLCEQREDFPYFTKNDILTDEDVEKLNDQIAGTFYNYVVKIGNKRVTVKGRDAYSCIGQAFLKAQSNIEN